MFDYQRAIQQFQNAIEFVNARLINREEVVEQIFCAILTGEHALIQSRTGVAKSLLAEQVFSMFSGANYFKVQASKEQQPDTYFGALDIGKLKEGIIWHRTEGSLVVSQFGFIDEIFDANDFTLRALLSLLNERQLMLGVQNERSAIHTVISATNYLRISDITEALLDRFAYQSVIYPDKDPYMQFRIAQQYLVHGGKTTSAPEKIEYQTLSEVTKLCRGEHQEVTITIPQEIVYYTNLVVRYYEELRNRQLATKPDEMPGRDFYISPRKQMKAFDLLRAIAFMHGRTNVTLADVDKLYVLFTTIGIHEERDIWKKASDALSHQFNATKALEQIRILLDLKEILDKAKATPDLLMKPIPGFDGTQTKRSIIEWARETTGLDHADFEKNKRVITEFLEKFEPTTDEVRDLRSKVQRDAWVLFQSGRDGAAGFALR